MMIFLSRSGRRVNLSWDAFDAERKAAAAARNGMKDIHGEKGPGSGPHSGNGKSDSPKVRAMKERIAARDARIKAMDAQIAQHQKDIDGAKAGSAELDRKIAETTAKAEAKEAENAAAHGDLRKTIGDLKGQIADAHQKIAESNARSGKMLKQMAKDETK